MRIYLNNAISYRQNNLASLMAALASEVNNNNNQMEELTMTTNNTTTTTTTNQSEELTMTTTTNNTTKEAASILENIKAGKSTVTKAVKGFDFKDAINKAWKAVKEYDYMGTINKVWDKAVDMGISFDGWLSGTKTGRTVAYTVKATSYLFTAGLFTHGVVGAVLLGAAMHTTADYFFTSGDARPSFKDAVVSYAKNIAIMFGMTAVAWVVFPYVLAALTWAYYTAVAGVMLPLVSVVL